MTPPELIAAGRTWIDVPFRHQGRSRVSVDCVGFLLMLLTEADALPADFEAPRDYGRSPNGDLQRIVEQYCVRTDKVEVGALALMRWPAQKFLSHVGLLTGDNLIHCYERMGKVVEHRYGQPWVRMTEAIYRLPGIAYE